MSRYEENLERHTERCLQTTNLYKRVFSQYRSKIDEFKHDASQILESDQERVKAIFHKYEGTPDCLLFVFSVPCLYETPNGSSRMGALPFACSLDNLEMVKLLVQYCGLDVNQQGSEEHRIRLEEEEINIYDLMDIYTPIMEACLNVKPKKIICYLNM